MIHFPFSQVKSTRPEGTHSVASMMLSFTPKPLGKEIQGLFAFAGHVLLSYDVGKPIHGIIMRHLKQK
jgi:hypothetical protein